MKTAHIALSLVVAASAMSGSSGGPRRLMAAAPRVILEALPPGAIQPQAAVDSRGVVRLVYYTGQPDAGDLYYVRYPADRGVGAASAPLRVNSQPKTATAAGTIRSEQIAIGTDDQVHVIWNGLGAKASTGYPTMYMAYTRLDSTGARFEPQRNLCTYTGNLDGGGSVAADHTGNVYVTWHAGTPGNREGEAGRAVYLAASRDGGATFSRERRVNAAPTGACGCCSMRAFVDRAARVRVLYRAAMHAGAERDTMLLTSLDRGMTFALQNLDRWALNACPMSSMGFAEDQRGTLACWETREQVYWARVGPDGRLTTRPIVAPGAEKSKHPLLLTNRAGQLLFAWTEGTGWERGGRIGWQAYNTDGSPLGSVGHADGLPAWCLLSGYARSDGSFVILY